jgi:hypothetical protein
MAATHESFDSTRDQLVAKCKNLIETYGFTDYSAFACDIGHFPTYAENVWKHGVILSKTIPESEDFASANFNLLEASAEFTYCKHLVIYDITRTFPHNVEEVKKVLNRVEQIISRYLVPGVYSEFWHGSLKFLSTEGMEECHKYESELHPKVKELSMVQKDGVWTKSKVVKEFTELPNIIFEEHPVATTPTTSESPASTESEPVSAEPVSTDPPAFAESEHVSEPPKLADNTVQVIVPSGGAIMEILKNFSTSFQVTFVPETPKE